MRTKTVSEKSTKKEILDAYDELISQASPAIPTEKASRVVASTGRTIDQLQKEFRVKLDEVSVLLRQGADTLIDDLRAASEALEKTIEKKSLFEKALQEDEKRLMTERKREQEEYDYDFSKRKKRQEEELADLRESFEADIRKRREALAEQEKEVTDLRKRAETFEAQLTAVEKQTVEQTTKMLEVDHKQSIAFTKQEHQAAEQLLKQKIELLQKTMTAQEKELERLQKELATTNDRLTRIAEKAVAKEPVYQPHSETFRGQGNK